MRPVAFARIFVCLAVGFVSSLAVADDFPTPINTESLPDDTLMTAADAAKGFKVPEGFKVSVFASEPDVQNPIAMS